MMVLIHISYRLLRWSRLTVRYLWPLSFAVMLVVTSLSFKSGMWIWSDRWVTCLFSWVAAGALIYQVIRQKPEIVLITMLTAMAATLGKIVALVVFFDEYTWEQRMGGAVMWMCFAVASVTSANSNIVGMTILERKHERPEG